MGRLNRVHTRFEKKERIAVLTLTDARTRNALTGEDMLNEVVGAIDEASEDVEVGVLIIQGEGPAFSAHYSLIGPNRHAATVVIIGRTRRKCQAHGGKERPVLGHARGDQ